MRTAAVITALSMAAGGLACCGCERSDAPVQAKVTSATEPSDRTPSPASSTSKNKSAANLGEPPGVREITFDHIKLDMEKDEQFKRSLITAQIEALDEKPVRLRGYILPSFQQSGITQFVLVRDNLECCFGPGAALYDCVLVEMNPGQSVDYTIRPVAVEGTFSIRELTDPDGKHLAIYHIDGDAVE